VPDLSRLTDAPEVYHERHRDAVERHDFQARALAQWGLIAQGARSVPYLRQMLQSTSPDVREDAAGAFGEIASRDPSVVDGLMRVLDAETDPQVIDSIIVALGQLRDKRAIGALAPIVLSPDTDGDTRHTAVQSLATIARRRFDRSPEPAVAAADWLRSKGYSTTDGATEANPASTSRDPSH
jgi:HEAT repeat protein